MPWLNSLKLENDNTYYTQCEGVNSSTYQKDNYIYSTIIIMTTMRQNEKSLMKLYLKFKIPYRKLDRISGNNPGKSKGFISWSLIDRYDVKEEGGKLFLHSLTQVNTFVNELEKTNHVSIDKWIKMNPSSILEQYRGTHVLADSDDSCYAILKGELRNITQSFFSPLKNLVPNCQNTKCNTNIGVLDTAHNLKERKQLFLDAVKKTRPRNNRYDVYKIMKRYLEYHKNKKSVFFLCKTCHTKFDHPLNKSEKNALNESKQKSLIKIRKNQFKKHISTLGCYGN